MKKEKPKIIKTHPLEDVAKLKDPLNMFDLCIASAYFAGQFHQNIPVEETRKVFEAIKKLL